MRGFSSLIIAAPSAPDMPLRRRNVAAINNGGKSPTPFILRAMSRVARILSTVLITAGLVVMADVGLTLAYKEPISSIYGEIKQHAAEGQLKDLESHYPSKEELRAIAGVHGIDRKARILARR